MSNSDARKSNSHEDFNVGEENKDDVVQVVEAAKKVEEPSLNDDKVQQSTNKRKREGSRQPSHVWGHFSKVTLMVN